MEPLPGQVACDGFKHGVNSMVRGATSTSCSTSAMPVEWLLVQWPPEEKGPTKSWLSTLPEDIPFDRLVALAKLRWRIERDYQELKQELGLEHYEGRSWRGFPSPRHPVHLGLRLPRRRAGDDFPLRACLSGRVWLIPI